MAKKKSTCLAFDPGVCKLTAMLATVVGILFLLQDLAIWNFWNISWYTIAFLIIGIGSFLGVKE